MTRKKKKFYPDYLIEIALVIFILLEVAIVLAVLFPPSIGREIDFSAPYRPMPEWYFFWIYQLVRYFPGKWAPVGIILLPLGATLLFVLLPWLDRGEKGRMRAILAGTFLLLAFALLTLIPVFRP